MMTYELVLERGDIFTLKGFVYDANGISSKLGAHHSDDVLATLFPWMPEESINLSFYFHKSDSTHLEKAPVVEKFVGFFKDNEGFYVRFTLSVTNTTYLQIDMSESIKIKDAPGHVFFKKEDLMKVIAGNYNYKGKPENALPWYILHPVILNMMLQDIYDALHSRGSFDRTRYNPVFTGDRPPEIY